MNTERWMHRLVGLGHAFLFLVIVADFGLFATLQHIEPCNQAKMPNLWLYHGVASCMQIWMTLLFCHKISCTGDFALLVLWAVVFGPLCYMLIACLVYSFECQMQAPWAVGYSGFILFVSFNQALLTLITFELGDPMTQWSRACQEILN